jgi:hypothetical protein
VVSSLGGIQGSKVLGSAFKEGPKSFNPERGTVNLEPLGFRVQERFQPQAFSLIEELF